MLLLVAMKLSLLLSFSSLESSFWVNLLELLRLQQLTTKISMIHDLANHPPIPLSATFWQIPEASLSHSAVLLAFE